MSGPRSRASERNPRPLLEDTALAVDDRRPTEEQRGAFAAADEAFTNLARMAGVPDTSSFAEIVAAVRAARGALLEAMVDAWTEADGALTGMAAEDWTGGRVRTVLDVNPRALPTRVRELAQAHAAGAATREAWARLTGGVQELDLDLPETESDADFVAMLLRQLHEGEQAAGRRERAEHALTEAQEALREIARLAGVTVDPALDLAPQVTLGVHARLQGIEPPPAAAEVRRGPARTSADVEHEALVEIADIVFDRAPAPRGTPVQRVVGPYPSDVVARVRVLDADATMGRQVEAALVDYVGGTLGVDTVDLSPTNLVHEVTGTIDRWRDAARLMIAATATAPEGVRPEAVLRDNLTPAQTCQRVTDRLESWHVAGRELLAATLPVSDRDRVETMRARDPRAVAGRVVWCLDDFRARLAQRPEAANVAGVEALLRAALVLVGTERR